MFPVKVDVILALKLLIKVTLNTTLLYIRAQITIATEAPINRGPRNSAAFSFLRSKSGFTVLITRQEI